MTGHVGDVDLAHRLADAADAISMSRFRALDLRVTAKPDLTPVSDADTSVEREIRALLADQRPGDGLLGEEYGAQPATGPHDRRWVIDPIDGTKNFVRGVPVWATLIALLEGDRPVVGLVSAPALGRRWWGAPGLGAYAGPDAASGEPIRVSGVRDLADASVCYSSLTGWEAADRLDAVLQLMRDTWRSRAYGDFYGYMLLAEGALDVMVEPELSLWDIAALVPIVTAAGGTITTLDGTPAPGGSVSGEISAIATNGPLHADVLSRLGRPTER
ncbi:MULTISPECIES: histidinol-phosphatase [unclassified Micromonospora]|uniref:histidinol-phosphatase n=1 Tax=unclassified Micromonospora TaxID=2617518 RepID=UPI001C5DBAD7|nr:histidinol-phosphatase [Micromonospora sp. RL09-050-HVF-A]MBW4703026.1 histidinol-phosphatase [Micromonospora sp. RL09-050-HVF-A]